MFDKEEIVRNLSNHYIYQVMKAFGNVDPASTALQIIATSVKEIFRYFEPSFFSGHFLVCKNFDDTPCLDEAKGSLLYDKNILLKRTKGLLIIQVFNSGKMVLWEEADPAELLSQHDVLIYSFRENKETFYANGVEIDATIYNTGSRFATQFNDLVEALGHYARTKVLKSTCKHFTDSWSDGNRLFFQGGGSGSNIPEKFMQLSLYEFLSAHFVRGISMDSSREYNAVGDFSKPKPVDVKISWREANRVALIEVKFVGTIKKNADGTIYEYTTAKTNAGLIQLKGYHDAISGDLPTTIIKSYLVAIDGRRNGLSENQVIISEADGMHFKDEPLEVAEGSQFDVQGFEGIVRMFAEPICV